MLLYMTMIDSPPSQSKFEKIYLAYRDLMYRTAYSILKNEADAEDAVHNAFIKIAENISKISEPVCPKTQVYVVTIVENKAIDLYRANQRRHKVKYADNVAGIAIEESKVHGLAACIAKLPPNYRQIILLKYHMGFSCKEIAKLLHITEANAIKLDQRAKRKLQQICEQEEIL